MGFPYKIINATMSFKCDEINENRRSTLSEPLDCEAIQKIVSNLSYDEYFYFELDPARVMLEIELKHSIEAEKMCFKGMNASNITIWTGARVNDDVIFEQRIGRKEINLSNFACKIGSKRFEFANTYSLKENEMEINYIKLIIERYSTPEHADPMAFSGLQFYGNERKQESEQNDNIDVDKENKIENMN